jgi:hypothetical protein
MIPAERGYTFGFWVDALSGGTRGARISFPLRMQSANPLTLLSLAHRAYATQCMACRAVTTADGWYPQHDR